MTNIVLANRDYGPQANGWGAHMSDEGYQLQAGLEHAGWLLCGNGYGDNCRDARELLERHRPAAVFVQDARDWLPESRISYRRDVGFANLQAIAAAGVPAFLIVKDAWGWLEMQHSTAESIGAAGLVTYYHHDVVRRVAPWTAALPLIRTYHSVDASLIRSLIRDTHKRQRAIVTGAVGDFYPLRQRVVQNAHAIGVDVRKHPGYSNRGSDTPAYLAALTQYRVHVATASKHEVAFRKIIESVACGCTPVTNLAADDVLPEIDGALLRIPTESTASELADAVREADARWDFDERMHWAEKALAFYDWKASGLRLSALLTEAAREVAACN